MNLTSIKSALLLSPHPDDVELAMGGVIATMCEHGVEVVVAVLSDCEISLPKGYGAEDLKAECRQSLLTLGVKERNIQWFTFPVRRFSECRQDVLETLVKLRKDLSPSVTFAPSPTDRHQDHAVVGEEARRCFGKGSLLFYDVPWNTDGSKGNIFVEISAKHQQLKSKALACYLSQAHRHYFESGYVHARAAVDGALVSVDSAERFTLSRLVFESLVR